MDHFTDTGSTYPTKTVVEGWINDVEDYIDHETGHAWRERQVTEEFHGFDSPFGRLHLKHRDIKPFDTNEGDKLEVASHKTNGVYTDFITEYTESITADDSKDFFVDYRNGIITFKTQFPAYGAYRIRITYRYGSDSNDPEFKIISRAAAFLVLSDMALQNRFYNLFPQAGKDQTPLLTMSDRFKKKGDDLIRDQTILKRPQHSQIISYSPWGNYYG